MPGTTEEALYTVLHGHVSAETAFLVTDYPYGYRLRCKIRYWLETNKRGTRFASQTTNPKKAGEVWNAPKASTYREGICVMYLDSVGHVHWQSADNWMFQNPADIAVFQHRFYDQLKDTDRRSFDQCVKVAAVFAHIKANRKVEAQAAHAAVVAGGHPDPKHRLTHYFDKPSGHRVYLRPTENDPSKYAEVDVTETSHDLTYGMVINNGALSNYPQAKTVV